MPKPFDLDTPHSGGPTDRPLPEGAHADADEIEGMFDSAFARRPDSEFISSLYDWWQDKGFLTERQYESLSKFTQGE